MHLIPAGRMRHQVTIQKPVQAAPDSFGGVAETFHNEAIVWAEVLSLGGNELWRAHEVHAEAESQVTLWYYPGLSPQHRFKFGTRYLNILSITSDPANRQQVCICKERIESMKGSG